MQPRPIRASIAILWFTLCAALPASVLAQNQLYLFEYRFNAPALKLMNRDGSGASIPFPLPASEWLPIGADLDETTDKLYWTNGEFFDGVIRRANLDGTAMQAVITGLKLPRGLTLDRVNGKMYWTDSPPAGNASGLVQRANLDGSSIETVYAVVPYDPVQSYVGKPHVDPVNGYVYFGTAREIRRRPLDGSGAVQTVVRGLSLPTAIALDVENGWVYFIDSNTNSDILGRCRFDDTDFTVLADLSPDLNQSSGLIDLEIDRAGGKLFFTDELAAVVRRCNLDGSALEVVYPSSDGLSPTALVLDESPLQSIEDCNENGERDLDDITSGSSTDCNGNGIPDECEINPCEVVDYFLDHGSNPTASGRTLSGDPNSGFEIFQPFDFATIPGGPPLVLREIELDGYTVDYHPAGFTATVFPDNGSGFPDETDPRAKATLQYRFGVDTAVWVTSPFEAILEPGLYWVRLTANDPSYYGAAHVGTSGLPSKSRRNSDGAIIPSSSSVAMRLRSTDASSVPETTHRWNLMSPPKPNPSTGDVHIAYRAPGGMEFEVTILDASGRIVRRLERGLGSIESHAQSIWNGSDQDGRICPAGSYFARIRLSDGREDSQKITRVR